MNTPESSLIWDVCEKLRREVRGGSPAYHLYRGCDLEAVVDHAKKIGKKGKIFTYWIENKAALSV